MIKNAIKMMTGQASSCKKVDKFLLDFLEGKLDAKTTKQFDEHIAMCSGCKAYLDQYRDTIGLLEQAREHKAPAELADLTLEFLRSQEF